MDDQRMKKKDRSGVGSRSSDKDDESDDDRVGVGDHDDHDDHVGDDNHVGDGDHDNHDEVLRLGAESVLGDGERK